MRLRNVTGTRTLYRCKDRSAEGRKDLELGRVMKAKGKNYRVRDGNGDGGIAGNKVGLRT